MKARKSALDEKLAVHYLVRGKMTCQNDIPAAVPPPERHRERNKGKSAQHLENNNSSTKRTPYVMFNIHHVLQVYDVQGELNACHSTQLLQTRSFYKCIIKYQFSSYNNQHATIFPHQVAFFNRHSFQIGLSFLMTSPTQP